MAQSEAVPLVTMQFDLADVEQLLNGLGWLRPSGRDRVTVGTLTERLERCQRSLKERGQEEGGSDDDG